MPETYPLLDFFGAPALVLLFATLLVWEKFRPLRRRVQSRLRRLLLNFTLAAPTFLVLRLLLIPVVLAAAAWAGRHDLGIARMPPAPEVIRGLVALLILDYSMFVWHWLNHRVPFLWRFHNVHHTDLDLDVSTAFRFHFGEMLLSVAVRSLQVVVAGATPLVALIYEICLEASTEFHHSNVRLPYRLEKVLIWFIVTPRAHGIHHSVIERETNSNFSNFLLWWDRLHGTVRLNIRQDEIVIGVPAYRDARELTLVGLLVMPFRKQRKPSPVDPGPQPERPQPPSGPGRLLP